MFNLQNNELRKQLTSLRHELQETVQMREAAVANLEAAQKACQEQTKLASEVNYPSLCFEL